MAQQDKPSSGQSLKDAMKAQQTHAANKAESASQGKMNTPASPHPNPLGKQLVEPNVQTKHTANPPIIDTGDGRPGGHVPATDSQLKGTDSENSLNTISTEHDFGRTKQFSKDAENIDAMRKAQAGNPNVDERDQAELELAKKIQSQAAGDSESGETYYLYSVRPNLGFPMPNGEQVRFKGNWLKTKNAKVVDYALEQYSRFVTQSDEGMFERSQTLPEQGDNNQPARRINILREGPTEVFIDDPRNPVVDDRPFQPALTTNAAGVPMSPRQQQYARDGDLKVPTAEEREAQAASVAGTMSAAERTVSRDDD